MTTDNMRNVDSDKWADHCSDYRTIATEQKGNGQIESTMKLKHHETGELIGLVDYWANGRKEYYIFLNRKSPKVEYKI